MVEINWAEVCGHAQISDDVHGLLRDGTRSDLDTGICGHTGLFERPGNLVVGNPANVLRET